MFWENAGDRGVGPVACARRTASMDGAGTRLEGGHGTVHRNAVPMATDTVKCFNADQGDDVHCAQAG